MQKGESMKTIGQIPFNVVAWLLLLSGTAHAVTINPPTRYFGKEGGGGAVIVTGGAAEAWTAAANVFWINVTPTTSGTGSGTVAYLVSANLTADNRSGSVTIGGQVHTVNQSGYASVINPLSAAYNMPGGSAVINVTVDAGISWRATSDAAWCVISSGSNGIGSGVTAYTVSPNNGVADRFANITVAGQVFTISQAGTDVVLSPPDANVGEDTSLVQFNINALNSTAWTVVPQVDWVYPLGTSSGSGAASITLAVVRNSSWQQRVATVQVGTALLTITQWGVSMPAYSITPSSVTAPSAGAAGAIAVAATMDAPWAATSSVPWVTVVSGATGAGDGGVRYVVSQNPYPTNRTGTVVLVGSGPESGADLTRNQLAHRDYVEYVNSSRPNNPDGMELYLIDRTVELTYDDLIGNKTIAFWFRVASTDRINYLVQMDSPRYYPLKGSFNLYSGSDGRLCFAPPAVSSGVSIQSNTWYHVMIRGIIRGVNMQVRSTEVWLDGRRLLSEWTNGEPYYADRIRFGVNRSYVGSIDQFRIWNRALSDQEIFMLYAAEVADTSAPTSKSKQTHTIVQAAAVGTLSSTTTNFMAAGGAGSVSLSIGSAAVWSVSSDSAWLTLVGTNSGFGDATINYSVAQSSTIYSRTASLTIAGIRYQVTQTGRGASVSGGPFSFGTDGGLGSFNISSENNASWSVANTNSWITITTGGTGIAPATCMFVVSPYGSPLVARTGFLYVGTNAIAVTQSGYSASVSPMVSIAAANGGSQSVTVSVPSGAIWSAIAQVPWITIIGGLSQSGSGNLNYIISGNAGGSRSGTIIVAGQIVTVTQNSATPGTVVGLTPGSAAARQGDQVVVPILGANFTNIQTAQFSVRWDYASLQNVGVEQFGLPGITSANIGFPTPGVLSFSWEHPTLDSTSLAPNAPLFALRFTILGTPGSSTQVRVDSHPTLIELTDINGNPMVVVTTNGLVTAINRFDISGNVKYQGTGYYVSNVVCTASGGVNATINTGVSNSYMFSVSNGANLTITATKNTDTSPSAGISTADVVLIRRHILGLTTFREPYKLLAADANGSGTVTTADITSIRKLILGTTNALPAAMWQIMPSDYIFQTPLLPWNPPNYRQYYSIVGAYSGQHFVAIKVGDVDGSWTNSLGASATPKVGTKIDTKGTDPFPLLTVSSGMTIPTGSVSLNIVVTNFSRVTGLQFSMDWDPTLLTYAGVTTGGLPLFGSGNIGLTYTSTGKLAVAWDDIYGTGITLADGTNLFAVNFIAKGVPGTTPVALTDVPTMREVVFGTTAQMPTTADGVIMITAPLSRPAIVGQSLSNNVFTLVFSYAAGVTYGIDYSTNLTSWIPASNPQVVIDGSTARWSDDGSLTGGFGKLKFYRVNRR